MYVNVWYLLYLVKVGVLVSCALVGIFSLGCWLYDLIRDANKTIRIKFIALFEMGMSMAVLATLFFVTTVGIGWVTVTVKRWLGY